MQSQRSTQQVENPDTVTQLLDVVEVRMMESISANTPQASRISRHSSSALTAAAYHLSAGGQRVRAKLALHAGLALSLGISDTVTIATTVELLHNASLVHDDIQDRDELRRGQLSVWAQFGVNTAICAGDLLLSSAYAALCKLESPQALAAMVTLLHQRTSIAIDGQCADLMANAESAMTLDSAVARYRQIAAAKSGALLCLPIELALLASGHDRYLPDARQAVEAFAVGYQIVDDLNDLQSDTAPDAAAGTFNIVSLCQAFGNTETSINAAKQIGRQHLDVTIRSAERLPSGSGALLIDYANGLRKFLVGQY